MSKAEKRKQPQKPQPSKRMTKQGVSNFFKGENKRRNISVLGLIAGLIILSVVAVNFALFQPPEDVEVLPEGEDTYFVAYDSVSIDRIDLTEDLNAVLWIPKSNLPTYASHFDPNNFKPHDNFNNVKLDTIKVDTTKYNESASFLWLEVKEMGKYASRWFTVSTMFNGFYTIQMYPISSNVRFNILDNATRTDGIPSQNGTYIISYIDFDGEAGVCQAPIFNLNQNTFNDFDNIGTYENVGLIHYTSLFGFIFKANDTIGDSQITLTTSFGYYSLIKNDTIYLLSATTLFEQNSLSFEIEIDPSLEIKSVTSGRIKVPSVNATGLEVLTTYAYNQYNYA